MKLFFLSILLAITLLSFSHPASAYVDGQTLLSSCRDKPGSVMRSICLGYISAIADTMKSSTIGKREACLDRKLGLTDLIKETMSFIEGNRLDRKKPAAELVAVAFANKYPCLK